MNDEYFSAMVLLEGEIKRLRAEAKRMRRAAERALEELDEDHVSTSKACKILRRAFKLKRKD